MPTIKSEPISEAFAVKCRYGDYFLTDRGTLVAAIELSGRDPDGLLPADHVALAMITQSIYSRLDSTISVLGVFAHYDGAQITRKPRDNPISDMLSQDRADALNERGVSSSRLVHYLEIEPSDDINKLNLPGFLKHGFQSFYNAQSRAIFLGYFYDRGVLYVQQEALQRQSAILSDALEQITAKWTGVMRAHVLSPQETWAHMRFMATLDPRYLTDGLNEPVPFDDIDLMLPSGDITPKLVGAMDVLKIGGTDPRYARIAAVTKYGEKPKPGLFGHGDHAPVRTKGNYLIASRWTPMSELKRSLMFKKKETELERASLNFFDMMQGNEGGDRSTTLKPAIKAKMEELGEAEKLDDVWGSVHTYIAAFGNDMDRIKRTCIELDRSLGSSLNVSMTWESVDVDNAFATLQPGGAHHSIRNMTVPSPLMASTALIYKSSDGLPVVDDLDGEESQYIFETPGGDVFHYSDFVGGRSFIIGVGPVGQGKTYFKNTLASHFLKYGGFLYAADIDPGTETLAKLFADQGGIFNVGFGDQTGFNPFVSYRGEHDRAFTTHISQLLMQFLNANDDPYMKRLDPMEQDDIDRAIIKTLALPKKFHRLSALIANMPETLQRKFGRWVYGKNEATAGRYAPLFDAPVDCIGDLNKRVSVFNLQHIKSDEHAMKTSFMELFYRITTAFEDPANRHLPKHLDVDEAKHALQIPYVRDFIISKVLTWRKFGAGISMWTQSPDHYLSIDGWDGIRSAASTFVFLADPKMEEALYKKTFKLTSGECAAIRSLTPRKEAYIVQPDIGVSKRVILKAEPIQNIVNTSHPKEASLRDKLIAQYGFEEGIKRAIDSLERRKSADFQLMDNTTEEQRHDLQKIS